MESLTQPWGSRLEISFFPTGVCSLSQTCESPISIFFSRVTYCGNNQRLHSKRKTAIGNRKIQCLPKDPFLWELGIISATERSSRFCGHHKCQKELLWLFESFHKALVELGHAGGSRQPPFPQRLGCVSASLCTRLDCRG